MIGTKQLSVTAGRPNFPLGTLYVRTGSAANVALLDVPVRGGVNVTAVTVRVTNADGAGADFPAVRGGNIWVVDLPASHFSTPGRVDGGVEVWASGTGADNAAHSWNIGVGDLCVLESDGAQPVPGEAWATLRLLDAAPTTANKGDCYFSGDALIVYDGTAWVEIGGGETPIAPSTDPSAAGKPADAKATGDALAGKLSTSGSQTLNGNLTVYSEVSDIAIFSGSNIQHLSNSVAAQLAFPAESGTIALTAGTGHAGNFAALDANGNPTDSQIPISDLAGKADTADLRYRIAEAELTLPADCFPVTFTHNGVSYSINALVKESEASAAGDMYIANNSGGGDYSLSMVLTPETESESALLLEVASFDAGGVFETGLSGLQFGGVAPVADTSPVLCRALADRTVNLITADDETSIDIELPEAVTVDGVRRARDFLLDVENGANANDLALEFTALGVISDGGYYFVIDSDDSIGEMMTIGAGERVRLYFTETSFDSPPVPVFHVARVTLGDFVTSTTPATQGGN